MRSNPPSPISHRRTPGRVTKSPTHSSRNSHNQPVLQAAQRRAEVSSRIGRVQERHARALPHTLPQSVQGSEPDLVAGGIGYVYEEGPFNSRMGQAWGAGGRDWGAGGRDWGVGRPWNIESHTGDDASYESIDSADRDVGEEDEAVAGELLLAMHADSYHRSV